MQKLNGWVGLRSLKIFAHHGVYEEERSKGNAFVLDVFVKGDLTEVAESDDIQKGINYESIASICAHEMKITSNTLEHAGYRIIKSLFAQLPVSKIKLTIAKSNPPVDEDCLASEVTMVVKREEITK